jgi:hypothetical protein
MLILGSNQFDDPVAPFAVVDGAIKLISRFQNHIKCCLTRHLLLICFHIW